MARNKSIKMTRYANNPFIGTSHAKELLNGVPEENINLGRETHGFIDYLLITSKD